MKQRKVLALNKSFVAVDIITMEKALKKVSKGVAKIIDPRDYQRLTWDDWSELRPEEGEDVLRSVSRVVRVPTIIQYIHFDKLANTKVKYNRRTIYKRDCNTCQYCGKKKPYDELSLDHVVPRCQGGLTSWDNIVVACVDCNAKKAGRTPQQANMKLIRKPKKPTHSFHPGDVWVKDWESFIGAMYMNVELENDMKE